MVSPNRTLRSEADSRNGLDFRCSSVVECMAIVADRGDEDGRTYRRPLLSVEAAGRLATGPV